MVFIDDINKYIDIGPGKGMAYENAQTPNLKNFAQYDVKIRQNNKLYDSYVLADWNTYAGAARPKITDWNHSTCFSFSGTVQVEVTKLDKINIGSCKIYPLVFNVPYSISGNKLVITLDQPRKLLVEMQGMEKQPLFIFADAPEVNVPDPKSKNVLLITTDMSAGQVKNAINTTNKPIIYFARGVHSYGDATNSSYPGFRLPVLRNKTYYIPGGA